MRCDTSARCPSDDHPRRPQQTPIQGVAALDHRQHRVRLGRLRRLGRDGLMQIRIKRFAHGVDLDDATPLERFTEQALGGRLPLDKRRGIGPTRTLDGKIETIFDGQ